MRVRALTAFLLFILLLGAAGYYPFFKIQQWAVRKEIKATILRGVDRSALHTIVMDSETRARTTWIEEREFALNGQMFDVVYTDTIRGQIVYYCIDDKHEKSLFANLDEMVQDDLDRGRSGLSRKNSPLLKMMTSLVYLPGDAMKISATFSNPETIHQPVPAYQHNYVAEILRPPAI